MMTSTESIDLADLINAYHLLVRATPPRRPGLLGFVEYFFLRRHRALGRVWTLWSLEEAIRRHGDPRVHFALNCGATSCPPVREYHSGSLDAELEQATRAYLSDPGALRYDRDSGTLYLSRLFKWYRQDFGDPVRFLEPYMTEMAWRATARNGRRPKIRYLPWSWGTIPCGLETAA